MRIYIYDDRVETFNFGESNIYHDFQIYDNRKEVHDIRRSNRELHSGSNDKHDSLAGNNSGETGRFDLAAPNSIDRISDVNSQYRRTYTFHGINFDYDENDYYNYNEDTRIIWRFGDFLAVHWRGYRYTPCNRSGCICNREDTDKDW